MSRAALFTFALLPSLAFGASQSVELVPGDIGVPPLPADVAWIAPSGEAGKLTAPLHPLAPRLDVGPPLTLALSLPGGRPLAMTALGIGAGAPGSKRSLPPGSPE